MHPRGHRLPVHVPLGRCSAICSACPGAALGLGSVIAKFWLLPQEQPSLCPSSHTTPSPAPPAPVGPCVPAQHPASCSWPLAHTGSLPWGQQPLPSDSWGPAHLLILPKGDNGSRARAGHLWSLCPTLEVSVWGVPVQQLGRSHVGWPGCPCPGYGTTGGLEHPTVGFPAVGQSYSRVFHIAKCHVTGNRILAAEHRTACEGHAGLSLSSGTRAHLCSSPSSQPEVSPSCLPPAKATRGGRGTPVLREGKLCFHSGKFPSCKVKIKAWTEDIVC